jgi:hypothetical protein
MDFEGKSLIMTYTIILDLSSYFHLANGKYTRGNRNADQIRTRESRATDREDRPIIT